jgi:alkyldihydroxyacetonephosphate synthase
MTFRLDRVSLLADVSGDLALGALEQALAQEGFTLDLDPIEAPGTMTVNEWLARGAEGLRDPWLDPADHLVAGVEARFVNGRFVRVAPAPRRAVGPDLLALVVGADQRFARVTRVWLRVHPLGVARPRTAPFEPGPDRAVTNLEARLLDRIEESLRDSSSRKEP